MARKTGTPWVLIHRPEAAPGDSARGDELLLRLAREGQLAQAPLSAQAALDLWQSRGWGSQDHWLLVSAQGEEAGDGAGVATGAEVLALLRAKGLIPRWEARRAFLKLHPENGEARQGEIIVAALLAESRMEALVAAGKAVRGTMPTLGWDVPAIAFTETDPQARARQADQVFAELAEALAGVRTLGGWWRELVFSPGRILACGGAETGELAPLRLGRCGHDPRLPGGAARGLGLCQGRAGEAARRHRGAADGSPAHPPAGRGGQGGGGRLCGDAAPVTGSPHFPGFSNTAQNGSSPSSAMRMPWTGTVRRR